MARAVSQIWRERYGEIENYETGGDLITALFVLDLQEVQGEEVFKERDDCKA